MRTSRYKFSILLTVMATLLWSCGNDDEERSLPDSLEIPDQETLSLNQALVDEGREIFRHNTFGDEALWTDVLELDKAIVGAENGGFGQGISPATALSVGLKVDAEVLPQSVVDGISNGSIDLNDPMTTVALLSLDAVVGLKATFDGNDNMTAIGITCALCHSTVDNSFSAGIGKRQDGWANTDLNVGAILASVNNQALADILHVDVPTFNSVVTQWGPGKFAPVLLLDGKTHNPNTGEMATINIPPAYGLQGITHETYTGWGEVSFWNRFIAVLDMGGTGNLNVPELNDAEKFPLAVERGVFDISVPNDAVEEKLEPLREYQLSLLAPQPDPSSYNEIAAIRGKLLFEGKANCVSCHSGPSFADNVLHTPQEIGIDDFEANRSPTGMYRTPPLRGLFIKSEGNGYFHDGRFTTLKDVVTHYDDHFELELSDSEKLDLVEFLKAL